MDGERAVSARSHKRAWCAALGAAVGIGSVLLWHVTGRTNTGNPPQHEVTQHIDQPSHQANPQPSPAQQVHAQAIPSDAASNELAEAPFEVADSPPPRARDLPDVSPSDPDKVIPHPIDEPRKRMTAQRQLFSQVKSALRASDYAAARSLLEQHDEDFSAEESWTDLREGYQLMLDCKQYPNDETRARGQRFVDEQRGSTLRRGVRRACLH